MVVRRLDYNVKAWNAVFAVSLALLILSFFGSITGDPDTIAFLVQAMFTLGLFGLSRQKEIGCGWIWKGFFGLYIILFSFMLTFTVYFLIFKSDGKALVYTASELFIAILLFLFHVIQLRGLYLYAFKTREVWEHFPQSIND